MKFLIKTTILIFALVTFFAPMDCLAGPQGEVNFQELAEAPVVADIVVEGNQRIEDDEILKNIPFETGDKFNEDLAISTVQDLYDMEKFKDISVYAEEDDEGNIIVIYSLSEKLLIEKIEFRGNEDISSGRLRREIEISSGDFFDQSLLDSQKNILEKYYRENGYAAVNVNAYTSVDEKKNCLEIIFHVEEGGKIEVGSIKIIGVIEEDYKKVRKLIDLKSGRPYREEVLQEGIEEIRAYYRNKGYLHAQIDGPLMSFDPTGEQAFITIFVSEGFKYTIGDMNFSGNTLVSDSRLKERIPLKTGAVYSEEKLNMSIASMQEVYAEKGHVNARIFPSYDYNRSQQEVDISFKIQEGPEVTVRNVLISGNHRTKDYVIRREITVEEGEPFDLTEIRRTQEKIFRLGFFKDVMLDMVPAEKEDEIDIIFMVEEQQTGMASIGAGYSSQDGVMGTLQVSQENFLGRGQRISVMWEFGERVQNYRLSFSEPYLFGAPTPFSASVYNTIRRRRTFGGYNYKERRRGGSISLGRHFTDIFTGKLRYSLEDIKLYDADLQIEDKEGTELTSSLTPSITFDTRDYPFDPRTGFYLRFSNQIAGGVFGGDINFSKFESKKTYFHPIIKNIVGVLNFEIGAVWPFSETDDVPLYEKFNVGGSESIRGYEYYEIEGDYKAVVNAEIKFPIVREKRQTILQGAVFYDVGGAWDEPYDASLRFGEGNLRRGFGAGIRFKTMAFPIRIDWGYGIDRDDPGGRWYFTMGEIF